MTTLDDRPIASAAPDCPPTAEPLPPRTHAQLIVLVGAAAAGKTRWARAHYPDEQILSSHRMREVVSGDEFDQEDAKAVARSVLLTVLDYRLGGAQTTVVDATNTTVADRAQLLQVAARYRVPAIAAVFATPLELCLARNAARPAPEPGRRYGARVHEDDLLAQYAGVADALAHNFHGEGFAEVWQLSDGDEVVLGGVPTTPGAIQVRRCRACGCTDNRACPGGCAWVNDPLLGDLCSACAEPPTRSVPELPVKPDSPIRVWFGAGNKARYSVHPRRLLEAMPLSWQARWVELCAEFDVATAQIPQASGYVVRAVELAGDLSADQRAQYRVSPETPWYELVPVEDPVPAPVTRPLTPLRDDE